MTEPDEVLRACRARPRATGSDPTGRSMRFSTRTPDCSTRAFVSGRRLSVSESLRAPKIFDLVSTAMNEMSTLLLVPRLRSRPLSSTPTSTEALGCGPLNGRGEYTHGEAAHLQRAVEGLEHLLRHPAGLRASPPASPSGRAYPRRGAHDDTGLVHLHLDAVELAVRLGGRRIVREHVVRAVVPHDAVEHVRGVVAVHRGEAAALVRQPAQAVLREAQFVAHRARPMPDAGSDWSAKLLTPIVSSPRRGKPPRIDAVDADVRPRRHRDRLPDVVHDRGRGTGRRVVAADDVVDVVVDPLAEEEHRLAAAVDPAEPLRDLAERRQHVRGVVGTLGVVGIVDPRHRAGAWAADESAIIASMEYWSLRASSRQTAACAP